GRAPRGAGSNEERQANGDLERLPVVERRRERRQQQEALRYGAEPVASGAVLLKEQMARPAHAQKLPVRQRDQVAVRRLDGGAAQFASLEGRRPGSADAPRNAR